MDDNRVSLDDLALNVAQKVGSSLKDSRLPYVGMEHLETDAPRIAGSAPASSSIGVNAVFRAGDTLFGKLRPNLRKVAHAQFGGYCSTDILVIRARDGVDPAYLTHAFRSRSVLDFAVATAFGTKMPRTSWSLLASRRVVRRSASEQRQIAAILDTLDMRVLESEAAVEKRTLLRLGLLNELIPDASSNLRTPVDGWNIAPVSALCERMTVGVVNSATHAYVDDGVPFLRSQNVRPGRIDTDGMLFVTEAFNRTQMSSILRTGDIVVVRTGYPGTTAVIPEALDGANCFSLLVGTPRRAVVRPEYLALYLNSDACKAQIGRLQFGSAQHNLNLAELKRIPVPVPSLKEQDRILEVARAADGAIDAEAREVTKLRLLRTGVSVGLFTDGSRIEVRAS